MAKKTWRRPGQQIPPDVIAYPSLQVSFYDGAKGGHAVNEFHMELALELTRMAADSQNPDWLKMAPSMRAEEILKLFQYYQGALVEFTGEEFSYHKSCQMEDLNPDDLAD